MNLFLILWVFCSSFGFVNFFNELKIQNISTMLHIRNYSYCVSAINQKITFYNFFSSHHQVSVRAFQIELLNRFSNREEKPGLSSRDNGDQLSDNESDVLSMRS